MQQPTTFELTINLKAATKAGHYHVMRVGDLGDVSAGSSEAGQQTTCNGVATPDHDNRDGCSRPLYERCGIAALREDHIWFEVDQVIGGLLEALYFSICVPVFDGNSLSNDVSKRF